LHVGMLAAGNDNILATEQLLHVLCRHLLKLFMREDRKTRMVRIADVQRLSILISTFHPPKKSLQPAYVVDILIKNIRFEADIIFELTWD
jgi:hypothetical protein